MRRRRRRSGRRDVRLCDGRRWPRRRRIQRGRARRGGVGCSRCRGFAGNARGTRRQARGADESQADGRTWPRLSNRSGRCSGPRGWRWLERDPRIRRGGWGKRPVRSLGTKRRFRHLGEIRLIEIALFRGRGKMLAGSMRLLDAVLGRLAIGFGNDPRGNQPQSLRSREGGASQHQQAESGPHRHQANPQLAGTRAKQRAQNPTLDLPLALRRQAVGRRRRVQERRDLSEIAFPILVRPLSGPHTAAPSLLFDN